MGISSHANTGTLGAGDQAGASRVGVYTKSGKGNYTLSHGNVTEPKTMATNSSLAAKHTVRCRW